MKPSGIRWGWVLFVAAGVIVAIAASGGGDSSTTSTAPREPSKPTHITPTTAGPLAHCQKVTGAYMFQAEGLPFTAAYRNGIDGACKAADPNTSVAAVAEVAKGIARGEVP